MSTQPYTAEQARREFPREWLFWGECVELCRRFRVGRRTFKKVKTKISTHEKITPTSWTRYDRDELLAMLLR